MTTGEAHPETRRMMETAIRRLNALEYVILGVAMALALVAGALAAWMFENLFGVPFRPTWAVSSILFFIVPGWIVLRRERLADTGAAAGSAGAVGNAGKAGATEQTEPAGTGDITEERDHGGR
jgi:uncharacterized membrane protein